MKARVPQASKVVDSFYTSPEWRRLVSDIKRERGSVCEKCGARDGRIIGDHVREIRDGGVKLDRRNVQMLCLPCHNGKTATAKRERMR